MILPLTFSINARAARERCGIKASPKIKSASSEPIWSRRIFFSVFDCAKKWAKQKISRRHGIWMCLEFVLHADFVYLLWGEAEKKANCGQLQRHFTTEKNHRMWAAGSASGEGKKEVLIELKKSKRRSRKQICNIIANKLKINLRRKTSESLNE